MWGLGIQVGCVGFRGSGLKVGSRVWGLCSGQWLKESKREMCPLVSYKYAQE